MADLSLLRFADKDYAGEAYQATEKHNLEQDTGQQVLAERTAAAPSRLRLLGSQADAAGTLAQTKAAEAPYAGPQAAANLSGTNLSNQKLTAELPYAGPKADVGLQQARANVATTHAEHFHKMAEYLANGQPDVAQAYSDLTGHGPIPKDVLHNSAVRAEVSALSKKAKAMSGGDRPDLEQQIIDAGLKDISSRIDDGHFAYDPLRSAAMPTGAPPLPSSSAKPVEVRAGASLVRPNTGETVFQSQTPVRIGTDTYGNPIYGPPSQSSAPSPAPAAPAAPPGPGAAVQRPTREALGDPSGGTVTDAPRVPLPGGNAAPAAILHGEEYLQTLPPGERDLIRQIAQNRGTPTDLSTKGGHRERVLQQVAQYDPTFDRTKYSGETAYQRTTGSAGSRVEMASNEVVQLIPQALEASRALPRGIFVPLNTLVQKFAAETSDPAYNDFLQANFTLMKAYGRAMNPQGVPRVTEQMEAKAMGILSMATSQQAYEVQVARIWKEVQASKTAVAQTREGRTAGDINAPVPQPQQPAQINMQGNGTQQQPYRPGSAADWSDIPPGSFYIHSETGQLRRKQ